MYLALALAAATLLVFTGCVHKPPSHLRESGTSSQLKLSIQPEVAYRRLVQGARACHPTMAVDADFFPDNRNATVSVSVKTPSQVLTAFLADVMPAEGGSLVKIYNLRGSESRAEAVRKWLQEDFSSC